MAVKFSQFTDKTTTAEVTAVVGYYSTGDLNIKIDPDELNTTYAVATTQNATNVDFTLSGTKGSAAAVDETILFKAGANITLTAGTDEIEIAAAADTDTTYTLTSVANAANVDLRLTGSDASTDDVLLTAGTDVSFSAISASGFTINSTATGDTYDLENSQSVNDINLTLDAATGSDSTVKIVAGTDIELVSDSGTQFTINYSGSAAGVSISKQQFTGNNSQTDFTLTTASGCTVDNLAIYIAGVYQNAEDASSVAQFTVGTGTNPILAFATAPPTTATNGIEVVITR